MATSKPRITITLTEHQHAVLHALSVAGGESMSSLVGDLIETAIPTLERVAVVMQAAVQAPEEMRRGMEKSFQKAESEMLPKMQALMTQLDMLMDAPPVSDAIAAGAGGASISLSGRKSKRPPSSNRGVSSPLSKSFKPNTGAASKPVRKGKKK